MVWCLTVPIYGFSSEEFIASDFKIILGIKFRIIIIYDCTIVEPTKAYFQMVSKECFRWISGSDLSFSSITPEWVVVQNKFK